MDYKVVFQKLPKTYALRKYGMGKLCPCCYFEKSLKVKQLPSLRFINLNTNLCQISHKSNKSMSICSIHFVHPV